MSKPKGSLTKDFTLYVQTYGRVNQQPTANFLLQHDIPFTMVVQEREAHLYENWQALGVELEVLPDHVRDLAHTREYQAYNPKTRYFVWMDDDLKFFTRKTDSIYLRPIETNAEAGALFKELYGWLKDGIPHVSVSMREGNNRIPEHYSEVMRMCRVLGYDSKVLHNLRVQIRRTKCREDFDLTLQLLRAGYPNRVTFKYAQNQKGSNTQGGCSVYRDDPLLAWSAHKLAKIHRPYVKVVRKQTKTAWGGKKRFDVQIQWKKAYKDSNPA